MQVLFKSRHPQAIDLRTLTERRVHFVLRRLGWMVSRAEVQMSDVNGPRGGIDKRCQVELRSDGSRSVVVASVANSWRTALDNALARAARLLMRQWRRGSDCRRLRRRFISSERWNRAQERDSAHEAMSSMTAAHSGFDERSARLTMPTLQLRSYSRNSGEAAARIVALALVANGRIKAVETAVLDALEAPARLGLSRSQWHGVIDDLCADLLRTARCGNEICIPSEALNSMLDQVDDEDSRRLVLRLCSAVVQADSQIDVGEAFVLLAAIERWRLHPDVQALLEPALYGANFKVRPRRAAAGTVRNLRLSDEHS